MPKYSIDDDFISDELKKDFKKHDFLVLLRFILFAINMFINEDVIAFYVIFVFSAISFVVLILSIFSLSMVSTKKEYIIQISKKADLMYNIESIANFVGAIAILYSTFKDGIYLRFFSIVIFYILNIFSAVTWKAIRDDAYDLAFEPKKQEEEKKEPKRNEDGFEETEVVRHLIKNILNNLKDEEKDIIEPTILKIEEMYKETFDSHYNINRTDTFHDIKEFLSDYNETLEIYKKGKGMNNLNFLKRLNSSAEEFYNNLYPREQARRIEELNNAVELLKIKSVGRRLGKE